MPDLELLRALAPPVEPPPPDAVARARRRALRERRRRRPLFVAAPLALGTVTLALVMTQLGGGQTFAAAAVRAAEASPRLLVHGWKVTRVDEWEAGTGEMTFAGDGRTLELQWMPEDRGTKDLEPVASTQIAGAAAIVGRYSGTNDFTARWRDGDTHVSARGIAPTAGAFVATLQRLEKASVEDWLTALPASAVAPRAQADAVDEMLDGLPLPPGFDAGALRSGVTRDRYQLGAKVAGAVACGWIARWIEGDDRAAPALAGARRWPILLEMQAGGAYPDVLWDYADAVTGKTDAPGGKKGISVEESYKDALGC